MANKTKYKKFKGKLSYAMVYTPDEYLGKKFWKMNFHGDEETFERMRELGIQNKIKDKPADNISEEDKLFMTFKRDCQKEYDGVVTKFSPPEILDRNGDKLVWYEQDEDGDIVRNGEPVLIGNGSTVEITLCIYPTRSFGNGTRLQSIRIIDLIEYNPEDDEDVFDEEEIEKHQAEKSEKSGSSEKKSKKGTKVDW